ncbi:MAG: WXG100 family type VII secretion target [Propionibacteriaceae bacterium]|jgi:WXG100 family type VII secretion target|nr:WXG100 family type VII secretion target [Propionibacteriaceae bacterium]
MQGMNLAEVRGVAQELKQQAGSLQQSFTRLDRLVGDLTRSWNGQDANRFQSDWRGTHRPRFNAAVGSVRQLSESLDRDADQQEQTSQAGGGAGPGGVPWFTGGSGGSGFPTEDLGLVDVIYINGDIVNQAWQDDQQHGIGDCYLIATIASFQETEEGAQWLRDHMYWDPGRDGYVVTLYRNGRPVEILVTDVYANGADLGGGHLGVVSIFERAYGQLIGDQDLNDGGAARDAIEAITGQDAPRITSDKNIWSSTPGVDDDRSYTAGEWKQIEDAVRNQQPIVGGTGGGDFSHGNTARVTMTDGSSATIEIEEKHAYTVREVGDDQVLIRNPWGYNSDTNGQSVSGEVWISREDYDKYFDHTDIGTIP